MKIPVFSVIVLCILPHAGILAEQARRQQKTISDRELHQYISKLALITWPDGSSKYPLDENAAKWAVANQDAHPNVAHEPYWTVDMSDRPWEQKCKRCPGYFKGRKVCAVDGTGDVFVNLTMCSLMRQNCIAGIAHGTSTGIYRDFKGDTYVVMDNWARFSLRQDQDAIIVLSKYEDPAKKPYYEIVLDGWRGRKSVFRKNGDDILTYHYNRYWDRPLGRPNQFIEFIMRWNTTSGWFLLTKSSYTNWAAGFSFNWSDPDPFPIKFISISGSSNYQGDWIIKDFVVTSMASCGPLRGMAVPLATSPTSATEIMNIVSKSNLEYFARLNASNIDPNNIKTITGEEY